jgi:hypothetical protein
VPDAIEEGAVPATVAVTQGTAAGDVAAALPGHPGPAPILLVPAVPARPEARPPATLLAP